MKNIVRFAVNNPVTIMMAILAILLLGKISYDQLGVDLLPDLNNPRLFIEIKAGERPPEEIEKQFVENIESMAIRQSDVMEVSSVVKTGSARITVEYSWSKDMDEAFLDLQKAMSPFAQNRDITELKITQHDPNTDPVVLIGMSHRDITDMAELRKVAESYIRNELIRLEGVAEVTLSGDEATTVTIRTDQYKLDAFRLTINDIASKIETNNQSISGGRVTELGVQYLVKSVSSFGTLEDFENLIVGYKPIEAAREGNSNLASNVESAPIFLREVANVSFENAEPLNIVRINGERSIGLSIYKEMRYNTVRVVSLIEKQLGMIEQALPGYQFKVISNQGTFITKAIDEVKESAILGVILAIVVLFFFLRNIGTTLIISLAIPISIVATFNLMYFNGLSLNIMTLGGLALGAGMLIDNAIVVIESIFRNREKGTGVKEACITGTSEVGGAVIASTLTTVVVFLPIVYMHGATGELFKDQAWTVSFSLVASLFVAVLVIPMLYHQFTGRKQTVKESKAIAFGRYGRLLEKLLRYRWVVIGTAVSLIVVALLLLPFIGTEFMPRMDSKSFSVYVKMPEGTRLERTSDAVTNLEDLIYAISRDSACVVYSHIGEDSGSKDAIFEGEHTAMMKVILSPQSPVSPEQVITQLLATAESTGGMELSIKQEENSLNNLLGSEGAPVVVEVKGEDLDEIAAVTEEVKEKMQNVDGLYNVMTSIEDGAPEIIVSLNRTVAGINNVSANTVIEQLRQQLSGRETGKMEYRGEMRDIVIKVPDVSLKDMENLLIRNGDKQFRLQEIARLEYGQAPKEIFRRNQSRISKITANLDSHNSLDKTAEDIRESVKDIQLLPNYSITVTGDEEKRQESMHSLLLALVLSITLVYMVLASQFESLLHPFTILLTIPIALVGSVLLFFLTGSAINVMGLIGIIMLAGIAINNSIILVDRINQLKAAGLSLTEAIIEAGQQRIRPIIMTSLTTILALLPMTLSYGEGASLRSPMAIAVIGGLVTSTVMSLMVIPCVYYVLEQVKKKVLKRDVQ